MAANRTQGTPDREQLLKMAITAAKANNKQAAKMMFQQVLGADSRNERALMWMAQLADSKLERAEWLQRVLAVNPLNEQASTALKRMKYSSKASDNRLLLLFGVVAVLLIVFTIVVFVVVAAR
jgi:thioredoxin-like negative regulator of GroEL